MKFFVLLSLILSTLSLIGAELPAEFPTPAQRDLFEKSLHKFELREKIPCMVGGYFQDINRNWLESSLRFGDWADIENWAVCNTNAYFRSGAISQAIQSILIAKYVESGNLTWDDDIHTWIPTDVFPVKYWNGKAMRITIRQLLMHQGGIRGTNSADLSRWYGMSVLNTTGTISMFADDPLYIQPGTTFRRSHHGFNLIGAIIEQLEQKPYYLVVNDFLRQTGMKVAEMDTDTKVFRRRVTHYQPTGSGANLNYIREPVRDNLRPFPHWAAEGVLSTVSDLNLFTKFVLEIYNQNGEREKSYISKTSLEELWNYKTTVGHMKDVTMVVNGTEIKNIQHYYVMGWERYEFPEVPQLPEVSRLVMLSHTSGMDSVSGIMAIFPEKTFALSLSANLGRNDAELPELMVNAFQMLYNPNDK